MSDRNQEMSLWRICFIVQFCAWNIGAVADSGNSSQKNMRMTAQLVGAQQILIKAGQHGLRYFPDEAISVLNQKPLTFLMVAGNSTWLMQGANWSSAMPVRKVLEPSANSPDNGYAGVGGVYADSGNKMIYAFYHAEDHVGYNKLEYNGVQNYMSCICMADAALDGASFTKRGPVITSHVAKNPNATQPQGVGDVTVCVSPDDAYLLAWYTDHSRVNNQGVQTCLARSPLAERGRPGSWKKWYDGDFQEPGLGGRETPVVSLIDSGADAWGPQVVYVPEWRRFVMVMNVTVYNDFAPGAQPAGGIRACHSTDGIHWSEPVNVISTLGVPVPGKKCALHPTLIVNRATDELIEGMVLYGYSPKWGHTASSPPHHLAGQKIQLKLSPEITEREDHDESLVGTYRLIVTNTQTKKKDPDRTIEIRADNTFTSNEGHQGTWKLMNGQLEVKSSDFKVSFGAKSGKTWKGTLFNPLNKITFRYELERIVEK